MAQCLAPSVQWQTRLTKNAMETSSMTSKMWNSVSFKQSKKGAFKSSTKFRICASSSGTINRVEDLLNLDVTPYTDKIIAEYIWYFPIPFVKHNYIKPKMTCLFHFFCNQKHDRFQFHFFFF